MVIWMFCVGGIAPLWTAANERLAGLTVRPDTVERSGVLLPPPPPLQAASSNARPAHRPCAAKEARPVKLPPFFALATDDGNIRRQALFFFLRFRRRFPKNISTMGEAGQRISSCRDVMTPSRDAMTQTCHASCKPEFEMMYLVWRIPRGASDSSPSRFDGAGHRSRARDRARGDDRLRGEESEGAGHAGAGHRERVQDGEGRGVRREGEARGRVTIRTTPRSRSRHSRPYCGAPRRCRCA